MSMTIGRIDRTGEIQFHDAKIAIWEEKVEASFKKDVFLRVLQCLNRLGWVCIVPDDMKRRYSKKFALNFRECTKGELHAMLEISGRYIGLEIWQDKQNVTHRSGGRYEFGKESRMTYMQRLEMERTRQKIRQYLLNVFVGYTFQSKDPKVGFTGATALEHIESTTKACWHYSPVIGRRTGEESVYNSESAEGGLVKHGARVWFYDPKGRVQQGIAYYNINNMWWVITGKYSYTNVSSREIFTQQPADLRKKRNEKLASKRLAQELDAAIKAKNFERCIKLRKVTDPHWVEGGV